MKTILFATRPQWTGVYIHLKSVMNLVKNKFSDEYDVKWIDITTPNGISADIIKNIYYHNLDILFIGGWDMGIKNIFNNAKINTKKISLWCSPLSQIDLGGETNLFIDICNALKNDIVNYISCSLKEDTFILQKLFNDSFFYSPVCLNTDELDKYYNYKEDKLKDNKFRCDLFCLPNARKNIILSLSVLNCIKNLKTYTNYNLNSYNNFIESHLNNCENMQYFGRDDYLSVIQNMDFAVQNTFSEGFNITAAEHMYFNIPVFGSNCLPYYRYNKNNRIKDLIINVPSNPMELFDKITKLKDKNILKELGELSKEIIVKINNDNKRVLVEELKRIFDE